MGCVDCEKFASSGSVYWYRWDNANIGILACERHAKEVIDHLRKRTTKESE